MGYFKYSMMYEEISALHKCIRVGDIIKSCYYAKLIADKVGFWRVQHYIYMIIFEETISLELFLNGYKMFNLKEPNYKDIFSFICKFIGTKKKWETTEGQTFYIEHMKSEIRNKKLLLNSLAGKYKEIEYNLDDLKEYQEKCKLFDNTFNKKSRTYKKSYIYGVPEILASIEKTKDKNTLLDLYSLIYLNREIVPFSLMKFDNEREEVLKLSGGKNAYMYNYIYSGLNKFNVINNDDIKNERLRNISEIDYNKLYENVEKYAMNEPSLPLVALDSHTSIGKRLMTSKGIDLSKPFDKFEQKLDGLDLRFSGSWFGVIWRIMAINQFGNTNCKWEEVKLDKELYELYRELFELKDMLKKEKKLEKIKYLDK